MNDEHLIECVRQYEVLYDFSNPKYMYTSYKNEICSKIAEQLKSDVKEIKLWGRQCPTTVIDLVRTVLAVAGSNITVLNVIIICTQPVLTTSTGKAFSSQIYDSTGSVTKFKYLASIDSVPPPPPITTLRRRRPHVRAAKAGYTRSGLAVRGRGFFLRLRP
ncbi:hypothetical protein QTP88_010562 [Uroleucon formosanum]